MLYQLSYFRIFISNRGLFLDCGCKGSTFLETSKTFQHFFCTIFSLFSYHIDFQTQNFKPFCPDNLRMKTFYTLPAHRSDARWQSKDGVYH